MNRLIISPDGTETLVPMTPEEVADKATWAPPPTADDVRAEAYRRIVAIAPEWLQRNLTARAAELTKQVAEGTAITAEQQAEWDAGQAIWDQIKAIRAASNAMEPAPPADYRDDTRWP